MTEMHVKGSILFLLFELPVKSIADLFLLLGKNLCR